MSPMTTPGYNYAHLLPCMAFTTIGQLVTLDHYIEKRDAFVCREVDHTGLKMIVTSQFIDPKIIIPLCQ